MHPTSPGRHRLCSSRRPALFLPARAQNAPPQVVAQTTATQAALPQAEGESAAWRGTLARVAESVVAIEIDQTRAFDTEWNSSSQATGFVVDAERGLILTNRHVVTPGPVTSEATFLNREEVQLYPVYRDPIHDFGIYRYDPKKLRFIKPRSLAAVPGRRADRPRDPRHRQQRRRAALDPRRHDRASSIATRRNTASANTTTSTPSTCRRPRAPRAVLRARRSSTSRAASSRLNAGGATGAASSFYLPLGRVKRALDLIQAGKAVPRGALQVVFHYTPYDELRRLGLTEKTEESARRAFPALTGMLVVNEVLPGGPADGTLQPGDVLVRVNGKLVSEFEPLEQVTDDSVGGTVDLELERGGKPIAAKFNVGNLHDITPSAYLEFGDAVVHTVSYQQARHFNVAVVGVYVANPGYIFGAAGVPRGAVIASANGKPTPNLAAFEAVVAGLADGERFTVRYSTVDDPNGSSVRSARMDRRWFPANHCLRDDAAGVWQCAALPNLGAAKPEVGGSTRIPQARRPAHRSARRVARRRGLRHAVFGLRHHRAQLSRHRPRGGCGSRPDRGRPQYRAGVDGRRARRVRRHARNPGRVEFVHPLHNLAIVSYDPKLIGNTPVRSAKLLDRRILPGEALWVVGMGADSELNSRSTQVSSLSPIQLPLSRTMQFRESNLETIQLVNGPTDFDGALTDSAGRRRRPVVELRVGERPRAAAGKSRRRHRRGGGHAAPRAGKPVAVLARIRAGAAAAGGGAAPRTLRCVAAQARAREPEPAPGVVDRAPRRRLARGRAAEAGRHPARHRRQGGHEIPRGGARGRRQARGERHRVARWR